MNQSDRGILLKLATNQAKLEEQNQSMLREMQDQNKHHDIQNGHILEGIKERERMKGKIKRNWLFILILSGGVGGITGLTNWLG